MLTRKSKEVLPLVGDLEGKVLVLRGSILKKDYRKPEYQLWRATGGFGCSPTAIGRAVFATCLFDGENARWDRQEFIGIYDEGKK